MRKVVRAGGDCGVGERSLLRVTDVELCDGYRLRLCFNYSSAGIVDLQAELYGAVFEPLRDPRLFRQVFRTNRTIEYGADFAPEYLVSLVLNKEMIQV